MPTFFLARRQPSAASTFRYPPKMEEAVLAGLGEYKIDFPMPPVRVLSNGVYVWVPWAQVYGPVPQITVRISENTREKVLASLDQDTASDQDEGGGFDGPEDIGPSSGFYRVFHIPDWDFDVTNFAYDGPTFFPVSFADYMDRVQNIEVLLDGQPTDYASFMSMYYNGQTNWGMGIYVDRIPNGTHQLQLVSTLRLNDEADEAAVFLVLSNLTRSIVVDNQVTFTNWNDTIWNTTNYTFRAQTKAISTDWWIDIYDAWGYYVNGASGHTTNGQVEWTWDLTDTWGYTRDSLENDPFFDPSITFEEGTGGAAGYGAITRNMPVTLIPYPEQGDWLIAYMDNFYDQGTTENEKMVGAMDAIRGWVMYRDVWADYFLIAYGTNGYTQADRDSDWLTLKTILKHRKCRNFYYFGHGNANSIGGDVDRYTNGVPDGSTSLPHSKASLLVSPTKSEITFNLSTGVHQYRFVWLDGCNTALGGWPDAFAVNKGTNDIGYYTNSVTNPKHLRPSAFVGWSSKVGGQGWGNVQNFFFCRSEWMKEWSYWWMSRPLVDALEYGRNSSSWVSSGTFWGSLRVYGYTDLKMNEYNGKKDWPTQ